MYEELSKVSRNLDDKREPIIVQITSLGECYPLFDSIPDGVNVEVSTDRLLTVVNFIVN